MTHPFTKNNVVLQTVLEKAGYPVQNAWNGTDAWQNLRSPEHPRLAGLDDARA